MVRPAPDFTWVGVGKTRSLRSLRGQPVVLVITDSPRSGEFKKQLKWLKEIYQQFASRGVVFIAALPEEEDTVKSDIPFVIANNGPSVAAAYGVEKGFALVVIGKDGNIDYQTDEPRTGQRVRDVIQNSFVVQSSGRK